MPAVVIVKATGEAVSYAVRTSDVSDQLAPELEAVSVTRLPQAGRSRWDAATRAVVDLTAAEQAAADPVPRRRQLLGAARDKGTPAAARLDALAQLLADVLGEAP